MQHVIAHYITINNSTTATFARSLSLSNFIYYRTLVRVAEHNYKLNKGTRKLLSFGLKIDNRQTDRGTTLSIVNVASKQALVELTLNSKVVLDDHIGWPQRGFSFSCGEDAWL